MTERTLGMDISKYQKRVDFNKAKVAGAYFVFIKASQCLYLDPYFVVNWENANNAGVLRGVYHYLDFKNKPSNKSANQWAIDQAVFYWGVVKNLKYSFPPVCDFEDSGGLSAGTVRPAFKNFLDSFYSLSGIRCTIYSSPSFWTSFGSIDQYWLQYPLWWAHYTNRSNPTLSKPFTNWNFWQYTSKGDGPKYGCESPYVDLDYFNGSVSQLYQLAKVPLPTPAPIPVPPTPAPVTPEKAIRLDDLGKVQNYDDNRRVEIGLLTDPSGTIKAARINEMDRLQVYITIRKAEITTASALLTPIKAIRLEDLDKMQKYVDNRRVEIGSLADSSDVIKAARINEMDRLQLYVTVHRAEINTI